jgi:4-diphosphocytidyl-2-C-methyl-D-erythritol kinase
MILFPPSKLNLGLQITGKRSDGFHDLQTIFYQIPLKDILEILPDQNLNPGFCSFKSTGLPIPPGENLCERAYQILHQRFHLPGVRMYLHKIIPMGAGLGGGSSDATYTLMILNKMFDLHLSSDELKQLALLLGSDCPLFISESPKYAEGRGDVLQDIDVNLKGMNLLVINPSIHISTTKAFSKIIPMPSYSCRNVVLKKTNEWKGNLKNDFENGLFAEFDQLKKIKETLYNMGAVYASMSGTGSTIYGLFSDEIPTNKWPCDYFLWQTIL